MIINTYFGFERRATLCAVRRGSSHLGLGRLRDDPRLRHVSGDVLAAVPHVDAPTAMMVVIPAWSGSSTWGNEPDFFRYAKAGRKFRWNLPTIVISYLVGALLFPVMGYMIAALSNQPDFGKSISYFVNFSMFGSALIGIAIIVINQWAVAGRQSLHRRQWRSEPAFWHSRLAPAVYRCRSWPDCRCPYLLPAEPAGHVQHRHGDRFYDRAGRKHDHGN